MQAGACPVAHIAHTDMAEKPTSHDGHLLSVAAVCVVVRNLRSPVMVLQG